MNTTDWLLFSYTLPAKHPGGRVRIWRRLAAIGAVQIKGGVYALPRSAAHREHLEWATREVEDLGGEALLVAEPTIVNLADEDIAAAFGRARDEDYDRLERDIRSALAEGEAGGERERRSALRKLSRRHAAIREIDFFPTGRGERAARLLDVLAGRPAGPGRTGGRERLDRSAYAGKTWVTRERPYVDRLASFWLVRRFIDPEARLAFLPARERPAPGGDRIFFDMTGGEFTHQDGMITFEVMLAAFGLDAPGLTRLAAIVRAIDLKEEEDSDEARAIRDVIDGLVLLAENDHDLVEKAFVVLDALHAIHDRPTGEQA